MEIKTERITLFKQLNFATYILEIMRKKMKIDVYLVVKQLVSFVQITIGFFFY